MSESVRHRDRALGTHVSGEGDGMKPAAVPTAGPRDAELDYEEASRRAGEYGYFQVKVVWILGLLQGFNAMQQIQNVFVGAEPEMICRVNTELIQGCPRSGDICESRTYTGKDFHSIVSEWDLACENGYLASAIQSIFMAGFLVSSLVVGTYSDTHGRRAVMCYSLLGTTITSLLSSFAPSYLIYSCLRFLAGFFVGGFGLVSFVYMSELVSPRKRAFIGMMTATLFAVGIGVYAAIAYFITHWRALSFATALPGFTVIYLFRLLPESPRWQYSHGYIQKAAETLHYIARKNGVANYSIWLKPPPDVGAKTEDGAFILLRNPILLHRSLVNIPVWFACSAIYYGLTLNAGSLGSNAYINVAMSGMIEIPGYAITMYILEELGRRHTMSTFLFVSGLPCIGIFLLPENAYACRVFFGLAGKMAISIAYSVAFIYTAELFPTVIRNNALGMCSTAARMGGIVSPMLLPLSLIYPAMEYLVYGILCVVSGFLILQVPDTTGKPLPETVADLEPL